MNKKTLLLIIALIAVLAAYFLLDKKAHDTFSSSENEFAITDTEDIDQIFLSNKETGEFVLLKKIDSTTWTLHDSLPVNYNQIKLLFETFRKIRVKRPVTKEEKDLVMKDIAHRGTKVEIYEGGNKPSMVYYVGRNGLQDLGSFFYMENAKEPYLIEIPGFNGYPGERYHTEDVAWRSKSIFKSKDKEIESIQVTWIGEPESSFTIDNKGQDPVLISQGKTFKNNQEVNLNHIKTYLKLWSNLSFEGFPIDLNPHKIDSISKTQPILVLELKRKDGKVKKLSIHKKGIKRDSNIQFADDGTPLEFDIETFYAFIDNRTYEVVQIQDFVFGKVMKKTNAFKLDK